jgi:hypothetical protein
LICLSITLLTQDAVSLQLITQVSDELLLLSSNQIVNDLRSFLGDTGFLR